MFENLTTRLQKAFRHITGQARVTEETLDVALREVRLALLEADVAVPVVKDLVARIREQALGEEVLQSLTPGQQVIKIVRDELVGILGGEDAVPMRLQPPWPSVIMLVGLQGSGKTTSSAKIGLHLKTKQEHNPLLVPADVYRPAATLQLLQVAKQAGLAAYEPAAGDKNPVAIVRDGMSRARQVGHDVVIVDTAGRLHIDDELMNELTELKRTLSPAEILFVADAMTGQDAVRSAREFHERIELTGVVLTKMDGDSRGGAALSVSAVAGVPIRFAGTGEKLSALEAFQPDRMAGRILGMGDVLTLIEKAEESFEQDEAEQLEKKIRRNEFTLEDFRSQVRKIRRMGPLSDVLGMIPGMSAVKNADLDSRALVQVEAIINSMTPVERTDYRILNGRRKQRIARGSGTKVQDVNRLVRQFAQMKKMMKSFGSGRGGRLPGGVRLPGRIR